MKKHVFEVLYFAADNPAHNRGGKTLVQKIDRIPDLQEALAVATEKMLNIHVQTGDMVRIRRKYASGEFDQYASFVFSRTRWHVSQLAGAELYKP